MLLVTLNGIYLLDYNQPNKLTSAVIIAEIFSRTAEVKWNFNFKCPLYQICHRWLVCDWILLSKRKIRAMDTVHKNLLYLSAVDRLYFSMLCFVSCLGIKMWERITDNIGKYVSDLWTSSILLPYKPKYQQMQTQSWSCVWWEKHHSNNKTSSCRHHPKQSIKAW